MNNISNPINDAVFDGIRKTINRFRENPFYYFTEADIHSSLSKDIMEGHSDLFILGKENRDLVKIPVSLIHHEYPTNFRFKNDMLKRDGYIEDELHLTDLDSKHGDRGHFDLVVLNPSFINEMFNRSNKNVIEAMKPIINKSNEQAKDRVGQKDVLFAIEVKFIHEFNAGYKDMKNEVVKDNRKLELALKKSEYFIMPINLIFCNSNYVNSKGGSVIGKIIEYLKNDTPQGVCSIFIQSYYKGEIEVNLPPIKIVPPLNFEFNASNSWANEFKAKLKI